MQGLVKKIEYYSQRKHSFCNREFGCRNPQNVTYLQRGIAGRAFERRFEIAEHIKVSGAGLTDGMLSIELVRDVPEEKKPRNISISSRAIEHKKAA